MQKQKMKQGPALRMQGSVLGLGLPYTCPPTLIEWLLHLWVTLLLCICTQPCYVQLAAHCSKACANQYAKSNWTRRRGMPPSISRATYYTVRQQLPILTASTRPQHGILNKPAQQSPPCEFTQAPAHCCRKVALALD